MYDILNRTMEYLEENEKIAYRTITYLDIAEQVVPKTNEPIKKFFIKQHNIIKSTNNINLIVINLVKHAPFIYAPDIYNREIFEEFYSYFSCEKECLQIIKKILKNKNTHLLADELTNNACCGIIMEAINDIQGKNCNKLETFIRHCNTKAKGINVIFDEEKLLPSNKELIIDTTKTLKKTIYKK